MAESCAAVFFVTPSFGSSAYLDAEIELARAQHSARGDGFSIITLLLPNKVGEYRRVPKRLSRWLCKKAPTELEGMSALLEALPPYVLKKEWYLPLPAIVPPTAEQVAVIGQNLAEPLGDAYRRFVGELEPLGDARVAQLRAHVWIGAHDREHLVHHLAELLG